VALRYQQKSAAPGAETNSEVGARFRSTLSRKIIKRGFSPARLLALVLSPDQRAHWVGARFLPGFARRELGHQARPGLLHRPRRPTGRRSPTFISRRSREGERRQQTKAWELRAALNMARLWRDQGKRQQARDLLAPVYGWFAEGFDTLDLKEAKALLDELHA
jgi:hypothetical protein